MQRFSEIYVGTQNKLSQYKGKNTTRWVVGVVVLKQLIFTASTLVGCGGLERGDFQQFPL